MSKPISEYYQIQGVSQRLVQTNENQFNTQVNFTDGKLLSVVISYYNRIKDGSDLYHVVHNVTLYKNDLDKTIYSGKYYSETNVPEVTDAANLLLKIFDKVTTTNLINNTTNYKKMLNGTMSIKVFRDPTMLKGIDPNFPPGLCFGQWFASLF